MTNTEIEAIRKQLAASPRPVDMAGRRTRLDSIGDQYQVPAGVKVEPVIASGVPAEWTRTEGADATCVVIFLHGGGYVSGSLNSHRHMVAQLGKEARARTLAVEYRLAPEHPFPAALDDALAAYRFVLGQGITPKKIALCGESAGGGLAVSTMVRLRDFGLPLPACAWLSSPWTDLSQSSVTMQTKDAVDPLIHKGYLDQLAAAYLGGVPPDNSLVSPVHADLRGLPPIFIDVGSAETLLGDATRLAEVAGTAGVRVTLNIWPDMIHAFPLFYQQLEEGRRALAAAGAAIRSCFGYDLARSFH